MKKTKPAEDVLPNPLSPAMQHAMALREKHMAEGAAWRAEHEAKNKPEAG